MDIILFVICISFLRISCISSGSSFYEDNLGVWIKVSHMLTEAYYAPSSPPGNQINDSSLILSNHYERLLRNFINKPLRSNESTLNMPTIITNADLCESPLNEMAPMNAI